jgi:hypothetical protein
MLFSDLLAEMSTLRTGPPNALVAQLLTKFLMLGSKELDNYLLVSVDPTRPCEQDPPEVQVHERSPTDGSRQHATLSQITIGR